MGSATLAECLRAPYVGSMPDLTTHPPVISENTLSETYQTFFNRVEPWLAPSDLLKLKLAYQLAKSSHRFQTRKELNSDGTAQRYFNHPRAVAIFLLDELEIKTPHLVICALLHDSLEDTRLSAEMIEHCFGAEVARDVKLLSKLPKEGYYERLNKHGNSNVWIVKVSDRIDNLRSMSQLPAEFKNRQKLETFDKILPLIKNLQREGFDNTVIARISSKLEKTITNLLRDL